MIVAIGNTTELSVQMEPGHGFPDGFIRVSSGSVKTTLPVNVIGEASLKNLSLDSLVNDINDSFKSLGFNLTCDSVVLVN